jgi:hypothetical protein
MTRNDDGWLQNFIDRETELNYLLECYDEVQKNSTTKFVAIIADSGIGKTRLVREFYGEITKKYDKLSYWPDRLSNNLRSLLLNPDFKGHEFSDDVIKHGAPFYWWSVRFSDPEKRNAEFINTAVANSGHFLTVQAALYAKGLDLNKTALKSVIDFGYDSIKELGLDDYIKTIFPQAIYVISAVNNLKKVYTTIAERHVLKEELKNPEKVVKAEINNHYKNIEATIELLFGDENNFKPLIIVLDDFHWADKESLTLIKKIIEISEKNGRPVFLLATVWPQLWKSLERDKTDISSFITWINNNGNIYKEFKLQGIKNIDKILSSVYPGLTDLQIELFNEKFGSDLFALDTFISGRTNGRLFIDGDLSKPLSSRGEDEIRNFHHPRKESIIRLFNDLNPIVVDLLVWATSQGLSFFEPLLKEVSLKLKTNLSNEDFYQLLSDAENTSSFIYTTAPDIKRFSEKIHYQVSNEEFQLLGEEFILVFYTTTFEVFEKWILDGNINKLNEEKILEFINILDWLTSKAPENLNSDSNFRIEFLKNIMFMLMIGYNPSYKLDDRKIEEQTITLFEQECLFKTSIFKAQLLRLLWRLFNPVHFHTKNKNFNLELKYKIRNRAFQIALNFAREISSETSHEDLVLFRDFCFVLSSITSSILQKYSDEYSDKFFDEDASLNLKELYSNSKSEAKKVEEENLFYLYNFLKDSHYYQSSIVKLFILYGLKISIGFYSISERLFSILNKMEDKILFSEQTIKLIYFNGLLFDATAGFMSYEPKQTKKIRERVVSYLKEGNYKIEELGNYQLVFLANIISDFLRYDNISISQLTSRGEDLSEYVFKIDLELIARDFSIADLGWRISLLAEKINLASKLTIGEHYDDEKIKFMLSNSWNTTFNCLDRLSNLSTSLNYDEYTPYFSKITTSMMHAWVSFGYELNASKFIEEAKIICFSNNEYMDDRYIEAMRFSWAYKLYNESFRTDKDLIFKLECSIQAYEQIMCIRNYDIFGAKTIRIEKFFYQIEDIISDLNNAKIQVPATSIFFFNLIEFNINKYLKDLDMSYVENCKYVINDLSFFLIKFRESLFNNTEYIKIRNIINSNDYLSDNLGHSYEILGHIYEKQIT